MRRQSIGFRSNFRQIDSLYTHELSLAHSFESLHKQIVHNQCLQYILFDHHQDTGFRFFYPSDPRKIGFGRIKTSNNRATNGFGSICQSDVGSNCECKLQVLRYEKKEIQSDPMSGIAVHSFET